MQKKLSYNIVLIGFMGTGKSTVSSYLSEKFGMETVEMDQVIEAQEGMTIPEIFATHGEEYFRDLETQLLIRMQEKKNVVISCGGGVPLRERNVREMKKNGVVVLLDAKPETVYERIKDNHDRPLLENNMNVEYIAGLMEKRREKYEAAADLVLHVDGKSAEEIASELAGRLPAARA
ncbi:MAG: shikimate kinase [Blautia sp.]|jgi:shikimate kinase